MHAALPTAKSWPGWAGAWLGSCSSRPKDGSCWDAAGSDPGSRESGHVTVGFAGLGWARSPGSSPCTALQTG